MSAPIEVRCDEHVGEAHPPRCSLCESLSADYAFLKISPDLVTDQDHNTARTNAAAYTQYQTRTETS